MPRRKIVPTAYLRSSGPSKQPSTATLAHSAIRIDVEGKSEHRSDARAGRPECRIDEARRSGLVYESFHMSHCVAYAQRLDGSDAFANESS